MPTKSADQATMKGLATYAETLSVYGNDSLQSIEGLLGLSTLGSLQVGDNPLLVSLDGLDELSSVGGDLLERTDLEFSFFLKSLVGPRDVERR